MPDVNGNPDTQEMYDYWNGIKTYAVARMNEAHELGKYADSFGDNILDKPICL